MRTVPPLVAAYLADLERRLSGADPAERADILDAVREHIEVAVGELGHEPTARDVNRILTSLGTVDDVAAAWDPDDSGNPAPAPALARPARRSATDSPLGITLVALGGLVLGLALTPVALALWVVPALAVGAAVAGAVGWARGSAGWRTACVLAAPVALVTGLALAGTLIFATNASPAQAPTTSVSGQAG